MRITPDEISAAAVAVAIASAVIAGLSLASARRSEDSAERSAKAAERSASAGETSAAIQAAQEHRQMRPQLSARVKFINQRNREMVITLDSDEALTALEVTIPADQGPSFNPSAKGVRPSGPGLPPAYHAYAYDSQTGKPAGLQPRQSVTWQMVMPPGRLPRALRAPGPLRVLADCHGENGRQWPAVLIEARIDPDITMTVG